MELRVFVIFVIYTRRLKETEKLTKIINRERFYFCVS